MAKIGKSIVKAKKTGDVYKVSTVLIHPQHTGMAKNKKTGEKIPAHYVTEMKVQLAGSQVCSMDCSAALSQNPFIYFYVKGSSSTPLKVTWKDNKGKTYENSTKLK